MRGWRCLVLVGVLRGCKLVSACKKYVVGFFRLDNRKSYRPTKVGCSFVMLGLYSRSGWHATMSIFPFRSWFSGDWNSFKMV